MGVKAWFIAYSDEEPQKLFEGGWTLDETASVRLAERLFADKALTRNPNRAFALPNPKKDRVFVGCYPRVRIVAYEGLAIDFPSRTDRRWLAPELGRYAYLHATHSVVDWFAFGFWRDGELRRAVSLTPDNGVIENFGEPLDCEAPFWAGKHPVEAEEEESSYPLPFHPLELSEAVMLQLLGLQFEGRASEWVCDPEDVIMTDHVIAERRRGWKFW